jgi:hypothetical protein
MTYALVIKLERHSAVVERIDLVRIVEAGQDVKDAVYQQDTHDI